MKKLLLVFFLVWCSLSVMAQAYPALSVNDLHRLRSTGYNIPLPTWLPAGFVRDTIIIKELKGKPEDKVLYISYCRALPDGTFQAFYIDAGFDGLGSLWYKGETVRSKAGKIYMYYQPYEEAAEGEPAEQLKDIIGTEWFVVNGLDFHVFCIVNDPGVMSDEEIREMGANYDPKVYVPIPKQEFRKILASLSILKKSAIFP